MTAPRAPAQALEDRDTEWILAMAASLGVDSGFHVPIVPTKSAFDQLFAAVRASPARAAQLLDRIDALEAALRELVMAYDADEMGNPAAWVSRYNAAWDAARALADGGGKT